MFDRNLFSNIPTDKPTMLERVKRTMSFDFLTVITVIMVCFLWLVWKPADLSYDALPFSTVGETFKQGDIVPVQTRRCNKTNRVLVWEVTRGLQKVGGDDVIMTSSGLSFSEPGCFDVTGYNNVLPKDLPPGQYIITGVATVPDVLGNKNVPYYSTPFTVTAK